MNILEFDIVKTEITRIENAVLDFDGRDVNFDINVLKNALIEIGKLVLRKEKQVMILTDMWDECHNSLDKIVAHFDLKYDLDNSKLDYHQLVVTI
ncbi:hypothetical protein bcgnr5372_26860 [Bacillus luti]|nr:hypothetical protein [Bacillus cereus]HDR8331425.1 hypothetical protein [Bacillus cereus]HDR8336596.1 hypothetical protein [Bacillus cereus]